jgi:hypothetical protein
VSAGYAAAAAYVRRIRNVQKRAYAAQYLAWFTGQRSQDPNAEGISYIAAQAVRMEIARLIGPRRA